MSEWYRALPSRATSTLKLSYRESGDGAGHQVPDTFLSSHSLSPTLDRFVLAATEHLHKRIAKMKDRIRQLEDALAILHAKGSNEPHPLLRDDVLAAENAEQDLDDDVMVAQQPTPTSNIIDAFGTLSVSEHGISRFFGPTGGSEASRCNYSR
jgi:hypothetical protein